MRIFARVCLTSHRHAAENFQNILVKDSLVIGRSSSNVLGFILKETQLNVKGWKMIELIDLSSVSENLFVNEYDNSNLVLSIGDNASSKKSTNVFYRNTFQRDLQVKILIKHSCYSYLFILIFSLGFSSKDTTDW